jgi:N-glycosylase/DNA lyase
MRKSAAACPRADLPNYLAFPRAAFDLGLTLESGQVFHWHREADHPGVWCGLVGKIPCRIFQAEDGVWTNADPRMVARYFALDDPLPAIEASFPAHPYCQSALAACRGMRIIRQPFWECLAAFICSSMKQVAHIRQIIGELRMRYGRQVGTSGLWTFPAPRVLAEVSEKELRDCRLGYRAKSLRETARVVADEGWAEEVWKELPTTVAREKLVRFPGVGPKIANCVLLFALHRLEVVPVDVWINRILEAMAGGKLTAAQKERRAGNLGPYAGYVQQVLFHHARVHRVLPS